MKKTYERPIVVFTEDMAEGIFAASGGAGNSSNCWTVSVATTQTWSGAEHVYEVALVHSKAVSHFSEACTVQYTFSAPIVSAYAEGPGNYEVSVAGNVVTVKRIHHANGEYAGDNVTYKLKINAVDQATTETLGEPSAQVLSCLKTGTPNYPDID